MVGIARRSGPRSLSPHLGSALAVGAMVAALTVLVVLMLHWAWVVAWLAGVNIVTVAIYGWDKYQARHGGFRVPERTLHGLSVVGGSPGAYVGQVLFRHKTSKRSFIVVYCLIVAVQAAVLLWAYVIR